MRFTSDQEVLLNSIVLWWEDLLRETQAISIQHLHAPFLTISNDQCIKFREALKEIIRPKFSMLGFLLRMDYEPCKEIRLALDQAKIALSPSRLFPNKAITIIKHERDTLWQEKWILYGKKNKNQVNYEPILQYIFPLLKTSKFACDNIKNP